jgi:hypothetical protein
MRMRDYETLAVASPLPSTLEAERREQSVDLVDNYRVSALCAGLPIPHDLRPWVSLRGQLHAGGALATVMLSEPRQLSS